jgi:hypothetical protein
MRKIGVTNITQITETLNFLYGADVHIRLDYLYSPSYIKVDVIRTFISVSYLPFQLSYYGNLYEINTK